ncbi:MAG: hypothetical protein KME47_09395 [Nodosilinea sp. WJT8-NPBG4]|nr:hypothetical protein [Nodosilinea sp. WJT8-NPBG4]
MSNQVVEANDYQLAAIVNRVRAVVGDLLGTFSDGQPSLTVEPPEDTRRKSANGLMVTIQREPIGKNTRVSGGAFADQYYLTTLINFDRSSVKLSTASRRLKLEFVVDRAIHSPATDESYEQIVFWICSPVFITN